MNLKNKFCIYLMNPNINEFNDQLKNFIEDLKLLEINQVEKLDNALYYLKFNKKMPIKLFREYILKNDLNRIMIFEEKEHFFIEQEYNETHENITSLMVQQIKDKWFNLNKNEKKKIWNYFKIFIYYSDQEMGIDTIKYNKQIKNKYFSRVVM